jgi:hypothetical protein
LSLWNIIISSVNGINNKKIIIIILIVNGRIKKILNVKREPFESFKKPSLHDQPASYSPIEITIGLGCVHIYIYTVFLSWSFGWQPPLPQPNLAYLHHNKLKKKKEKKKLLVAGLDGAVLVGVMLPQLG